MNAYYLIETKYIDLDAPQKVRGGSSRSGVGFIVHHVDGRKNGGPDTIEYLNNRYNSSLYTTVLQLYPELFI